MSFSHAWIEKTLQKYAQGPSLSGPGLSPTPAYREIVSDSRAATGGAVFVALRGDKVDGHAFVRQAVDSGAAAVIVSNADSVKGLSCGVFLVRDTLEAYRALAKAWREQFDIPVVAIAGAVGKTTTKEFLAAILSGAYPKVLKTDGSENGFVGIPKTLLRLRKDHMAAVVEIGIDAVGAMSEHLEVVRPTASVVTAIAEEHLEFLKDLKTIAQEEGKALEWVGERGGVVGISLNDPWLAPYRDRKWTGKVTFSIGGEADFVGKADEGDTLMVREGQTAIGFLTSPLPGRHNLENLLAAVVIARRLGMNSEKIRRGLQGFTPPKGRSRWIVYSRAPFDLEVLADYYNSSPSAVKAALEVVREKATAAREGRFAVLADMLELGADEMKYHADLAEPIVKAGIGRVFLFGKRVKVLAERLGQSKVKVNHFETIEALNENLLRALESYRGPATVLIKGSRSMRLERVFEALEAWANPQDLKRVPIPKL